MPVIRRTKSFVKANIQPVIGIDVSTHTGFVVIGKLPKALDVIPEEFQFVSASTSQERAARLLDVFKLMTDRLKIYKPQFVVIEGYSFASKFNNAAQVELGTAARLACVSLGIRMIEVPPPSLKKFITGIGKGDKNQILLHVYKKWGFEASNDNVADAYGLARMGACLAGWVKPLAYENSVLEGLVKGLAGKRGKIATQTLHLSAKKS
jgi:crossover junction endodeoxyribonuclease RuvC